VLHESGDFARIINGSLFSLNGGRSSESTFDLNRGHLYWITSVLNQFDKTPSAPIKFSERFPKPPNYDSRANSGWGNWGAPCFNTQKFPRTCNYFFGPSLVKQNDLSPWMCLCCADLAKLHRSMTDNNICISYSTHHVKDPHTRFTNFASVTVPVSRIVSINDLQTCYNLRFENDKRKIS